jgi:hypothetical protein
MVGKPETLMVPEATIVAGLLNCNTVTHVVLGVDEFVTKIILVKSNILHSTATMEHKVAEHN